MKKLIAILLSMLLLSSCSFMPGNPPVETQPTIDTAKEAEKKILAKEHLAGYKHDNVIGSGYIHEGDDAYYMFIPACTRLLLYRFDKKTHELTPMCKDENCKHTSKSCTAVFKRVYNEMLYDNMFYWVESKDESKTMNETKSLTCMDIDTMTRAKLGILTEHSMLDNYLESMYFYDGKAFVRVAKFANANSTKVISSQYILIDLKDFTEIFRTDGDIEDGVNLQKENKIYRFLYKNDEGILTYSLKVFDFITETIEEKYLPQSVEIGVKSDMVNALEVLDCNDEYAYISTLENKLLKIDFTANNCTEVLNFSELGSQYNFSYNPDGLTGRIGYMNGLFVNWGRSDNSYRIVAKDETGNQVFDYTVEGLFKKEKNIGLMGICDNTLFISQYSQEYDEGFEYNGYIILDLKDGSVVTTETIVTNITK